MFKWHFIFFTVLYNDNEEQKKDVPLCCVLFIFSHTPLFQFVKCIFFL